MKHKIKKIAVLVIKLARLLEAWVRIPLYAKQKNLAVRRVGKKPVVARFSSNAFSAVDEQSNTFTKLVKVLNSAGIDFFIVPHQNHSLSIGVMAEHRSRALKLINQSPEFTEYYINVEKDKHNTRIPQLMSSGLKTIDPERVLAVSFFRHIASRNGFLLEGQPYRGTLEFWSKAEDLSPHLRQRAMDESGILSPEALRGALVAPIANGVAKVFAPDEQVFVEYSYAGVKSKTLDIFTRNLLNKVNFPIDVVYTWVDGNDEEWQKRYQQARRLIDPDHGNNSMSRYTDHQELRYSLRSIEMYAPWVRNIYIVTDNQQPDWLVPDDRLKIIDHQDIFKDKAALPVFNSHAIESQLHHIKGLSEHYIYFNDDVLLASFTTPETFFFPNGVAKVLPSAATIGTGKASSLESAPSSAGKNARDIIKSKYGYYTTNKYRHAAYAQIKSIAEEIERNNQDVVDETMRSKFRDSKNLPFTSILMQSYLLASGYGVQAPYETATINVSLDEADIRMNELKSNKDIVTVCLNESITAIGDEAKVSKRIDGYLENNYPLPTRWDAVD